MTNVLSMVLVIAVAAALLAGTVVVIWLIGRRMGRR